MAIITPPKLTFPHIFGESLKYLGLKKKKKNAKPTDANPIRYSTIGMASNEIKAPKTEENPKITTIK